MPRRSRRVSGLGVEKVGTVRGNSRVRGRRGGRGVVGSGESGESSESGVGVEGVGVGGVVLEEEEDLFAPRPSEIDSGGKGGRGRRRRRPVVEVGAVEVVGGGGGGGGKVKVVVGSEVEGKEKEEEEEEEEEVDGSNGREEEVGVGGEEEGVVVGGGVEEEVGKGDVGKEDGGEGEEGGEEVKKVEKVEKEEDGEKKGVIVVKRDDFDLVRENLGGMGIAENFTPDELERAICNACREAVEKGADSIPMHAGSRLFDAAFDEALKAKYAGPLERCVLEVPKSGSGAGGERDERHFVVWMYRAMPCCCGLVMNWGGRRVEHEVKFHASDSRLVRNVDTLLRSLVKDGDNSLMESMTTDKTHRYTLITPDGHSILLTPHLLRSFPPTTPKSTLPLPPPSFQLLPSSTLQSQHTTSTTFPYSIVPFFTGFTPHSSSTTFSTAPITSLFRHILFIAFLLFLLRFITSTPLQSTPHILYTSLIHIPALPIPTPSLLTPFLPSSPLLLSLLSSIFTTTLFLLFSFLFSTLSPISMVETLSTISLPSLSSFLHTTRVSTLSTTDPAQTFSQAITKSMNTWIKKGSSDGLGNGGIGVGVRRVGVMVVGVVGLDVVMQMVGVNPLRFLLSILLTLTNPHPNPSTPHPTPLECLISPSLFLWNPPTTASQLCRPSYLLTTTLRSPLPPSLTLPLLLLLPLLLPILFSLLHPPRNSNKKKEKVVEEKEEKDKKEDEKKEEEEEGDEDGGEEKKESEDEEKKEGEGEKKEGKKDEKKQEKKEDGGEEKKPKVDDDKVIKSSLLPHVYSLCQRKPSWDGGLVVRKGSLVWAERGSQSVVSVAFHVGETAPLGKVGRLKSVLEEVVKEAGRKWAEVGGKEVGIEVLEAAKVAVGGYLDGIGDEGVEDIGGDVSMVDCGDVLQSALLWAVVDREWAMEKRRKEEDVNKIAKDVVDDKYLQMWLQMVRTVCGPKYNPPTSLDMVVSDPLRPRAHTTVQEGLVAFNKTWRRHRGTITTPIQPPTPKESTASTLLAHPIASSAPVVGGTFEKAWKRHVMIQIGGYKNPFLYTLRTHLLHLYLLFASTHLILHLLSPSLTSSLFLNPTPLPIAGTEGDAHKTALAFWSYSHPPHPHLAHSTAFQPSTTYSTPFTTPTTYHTPTPTSILTFPLLLLLSFSLHSLLHTLLTPLLPKLFTSLLTSSIKSLSTPITSSLLPFLTSTLTRLLLPTLLLPTLLTLPFLLLSFTSHSCLLTPGACISVDLASQVFPRLLVGDVWGAMVCGVEGVVGALLSLLHLFSLPFHPHYFLPLLTVPISLFLLPIPRSLRPTLPTPLILSTLLSFLLTATTLLLLAFSITHSLSYASTETLSLLLIALSTLLLSRLLIALLAAPFTPPVQLAFPLVLAALILTLLLVPSGTPRITALLSTSLTLLDPLILAPKSIPLPTRTILYPLFRLLHNTSNTIATSLASTLTATIVNTAIKLTIAATIAFLALLLAHAAKTVASTPLTPFEALTTY